MSDFQRSPNENWLEANQGETVLLQFPHGQYAVTVHDDEETEQLLQEHGAGGVPESVSSNETDSNVDPTEVSPRG